MAEATTGAEEKAAGEEVVAVAVEGELEEDELEQGSAAAAAAAVAAAAGTSEVPVLWVGRVVWRQ